MLILSRPREKLREIDEVLIIILKLVADRTFDKIRI